jgi:CheY-like chemotaxis protein
MVDGIESTRLIRAFEEQNKTPTRPKEKYGRLPIFALSGGLHRDDEDKYVQKDFDGWVPKPFDPARLALYFAGVLDEEKRKEGLYNKENFASGGWFETVVRRVMSTTSK